MRIRLINVCGQTGTMPDLVATINLGGLALFCIEVPDLLQHDSVLDVVKAWPIEAGAWSTSSATASLDDVCARRHGAMAGRDEETVPRSNKETDEGLRDPASHHAAARTAGDLLLTHGVPRSTTVLTKISSFLAQAMSATLCSFPAAMRRW